MQIHFHSRLWSYLPRVPIFLAMAHQNMIWSPFWLFHSLFHIDMDLPSENFFPSGSTLFSNFLTTSNLPFLTRSFESSVTSSVCARQSAFNSVWTMFALYRSSACFKHSSNWIIAWPVSFPLWVKLTRIACSRQRRTVVSWTLGGSRSSAFLKQSMAFCSSPFSSRHRPRRSCSLEIVEPRGHCKALDRLTRAWFIAISSTNRLSCRASTPM